MPTIENHEPEVAKIAGQLFAGGLSAVDPDLSLFIGLEEARQRDKIILIPSESIAPRAVRDALATVFTNIYAEGYASLRMTREETDLLMDFQRGLAYHRRYSDRRFYKGTEFVDFVEVLAQKRAAGIFASPEFPAERISVNVQPLSGAAANNAVYEAFVEPGGVVMGMALTHGGHLTHGSEFNRSGRRYKVIPYEVSRKTGLLDYDEIARMALEHKPRMIIAGASAYPWEIDWKRLRTIADSIQVANVMGGRGAVLLADISHPAGLVVAGLFPNPVGHAHVTTLTTHKTMLGPRGAIVLSTDPEVAKRMDSAVFPGEQGGPHINNIAAKAVSFKIATSDEFKRLQRLIVANCQALGAALTKRGLKLAYGGTSTHLLVVDLNAVKTKSGFPLKGDVASNILDICGITCNRNTIPGDRTAADSSGVRFGTVFMTQRGMMPEHCDRLADLICKVLLNIETFGIPAASGKRGRGKIDKAVVEDACSRSAEFVAAVCPGLRRPAGTPGEPSSEKSGRLKIPVSTQVKSACGSFELDGENVAILQLCGERLLPFLQAAGTANVLDLKSGDVCKTAFLSADASLVALGLLVCEEPSQHGERKAKLIVAASRAGKVVEWLTHLSDGFVSFDDRDIYAKIDGPVVVRRLDEGRGGVRAGNGCNCSPASAESEVHIAVAGDSEAQKLSAFVRSAKNAAPADALALAKKPEESEAFALAKPYFIGQRKLVEALYLPRAKPQGAAAEDACGLRAGGITLRVRSKLHLDKKPFEWQPPVIEARRSCLYLEHLKLTRKQNIVEFAGWLMPVMYSGIMDEHQAVRESAALFDVSHMGTFDFQGPHAERFLDLLTTNYVLKLRPGQSQYSYILDAQGHVLDDVMVYRLTRERFLMVANAANAEKIKAWIEAVASSEFIVDRALPFKEVEHNCGIRYLKDPAVGNDMLVDLALQGPRSLAVLEAAQSASASGKLDSTAAPTVPMRSLKRSELTQAVLGGKPVIVSRTGYTGEEFGYELFVHPDRAAAVWNLLLEVGKDFGLKPAGLGARDSTRTEAGLPLYGHELAGRYDISPMEAGYGAFVKRHKPFFIGKRPLLEHEAKIGSEIARFRVTAKGARVVRPGDAVVNRKGQYAGAVTSASLDSEGFQTGMALLSCACATEGTWLGIFSGKQEVAPPSTRKFESGGRVPLHEEAIVLPRFRQQKAI